MWRKNGVMEGVERRSLTLLTSLGWTSDRRCWRWAAVRVKRPARSARSFEDWGDRGRRFDAVVAAASWHWVDPSIGWPKAHCVLKPSGWLAVLGHVVVRRLDEPEVYAETIDVHERFAPGNPGWGHPPLEAEVRLTGEGWGPPNEDSEGLFGATVVRWYPTVQWFDGEGFADLLRSNSLYRRLEDGVREPLLDAIADRIRTRMGDRVARHYLCVLRVGQCAGGSAS